MGREYPLNTIADLLTIPIDRLDDCLDDIRLAIESAHFVAGSDGKPDHPPRFAFRGLNGSPRTSIIRSTKRAA